MRRPFSKSLNRLEGGVVALLSGAPLRTARVLPTAPGAETRGEILGVRGSCREDCRDSGSLVVRTAYID